MRRLALLAALLCSLRGNPCPAAERAVDVWFHMPEVWAPGTLECADSTSPDTVFRCVRVRGRTCAMVNDSVLVDVGLIAHAGELQHLRVAVPCVTTWITVEALDHDGTEGCRSNQVVVSRSEVVLERPSPDPSTGASVPAGSIELMHRLGEIR